MKTLRLTDTEILLLEIALDTLHGKVGLDMHQAPEGNEPVRAAYRRSLSTIRQLRAQLRATRA